MSQTSICQVMIQRSQRMAMRTLPDHQSTKRLMIKMIIKWLAMASPSQKSTRTDLALFSDARRAAFLISKTYENSTSFHRSYRSHRNHIRLFKRQRNCQIERIVSLSILHHSAFSPFSHHVKESRSRKSWLDIERSNRRRKIVEM